MLTVSRKSWIRGADGYMGQ